MPSAAAVRRACASVAVAIILVLAPLPAAHALDPRAIDPRVAPCEDFYRYANGGWLDATPVPRGRSSFGSFDELHRRDRLLRLQLLQASVDAPASAAERRLGAFVSAGLDLEAITAEGLQPIASLLAEIDALRKPRELAALFARWQARGLPAPYALDATIGPDRVSPPHASALPTPLLLPAHDYYLREDAPARALLGRYRGYVQALFEQAGRPDPVAEASAALGLEMRLAAALATGPASDLATLETIEIATLRRRHKQLDWPALLKAQGLTRHRALVLAQPAYFDALDAQMTRVPLGEWQAWLRLHLLDAFAPFLDERFAAPHEAFHAQLLGGAPTPRPRLERVLEASERLLPDTLAQAFAARFVPAPNLASAQALGQALRRALADGLEHSDGLDPTARAQALERLVALEFRWAESPGWPSPPEDAVGAGAPGYAQQALALAQSLHARRIASIGTSATAGPGSPVSSPVSVWYDRTRNRLHVGAGLLQPPLFDPDPAGNFGALGALIGHELVHAVLLGDFQSGGDHDLLAERMRAFGSAVAERHRAQATVEGLQVDAARVRAEALADLLGLELAWHAFETQLDELDPAPLHDHVPAQRFFLGWARLWRRNDLDGVTARRLEREPYPPPRQRVNLPLRALSAFAQTFSCHSEQAMVGDDDERSPLFAPPP